MNLIRLNWIYEPQGNQNRNLRNAKYISLLDRKGNTGSPPRTKVMISSEIP
jgi:hypothetical protein